MKKLYVWCLLLCLAWSACKKEDKGKVFYHNCSIQKIDVYRFPYKQPDGSNWGDDKSWGYVNDSVNLYAVIAIDSYQVGNVNWPEIYDNYVMTASETLPGQLPEKLLFPLQFSFPVPYKIPDMNRSYSVLIKNRCAVGYKLTIVDKMTFRLIDPGSSVEMTYPDSIRLWSDAQRSECVIHLKWLP